MPRIAEDLTGKRFSKLLVESRNFDYKHKSNDTFWNCVCDCGNRTITSTQRLKSGKTTSCGCQKGKHKQQTKYSGHLQEHIGEKHNKLTIIDFIQPSTYKCVCDCGTIKTHNALNVLYGKAKSCGCLVKETSRKTRLDARKKYPLDLSEYRQGRLVIKYKTKDYPNETWFCECDCGNTCEKTISQIRSGVQSCGCLKSETTSERFTVDMTGKRCGMITVIRRDGTIIGEDGSKYAAWLGLCDCGTYKRFKGADLREGKVQSCGCVVSRGELAIKQILNKLQIKYIPQYKFRDLKSKNKRALRFDFGIINQQNNLECLIEYQGVQHFDDNKTFGKEQREETDPIKKQYCLSHNISLYEIRFDEDVESCLHNILKHTSYANTVPSLQETA